MELLVLHATGLDWDEALAFFAALAVLTLLVITRLRPDDSATEPGRADEKKNQR
jgi:hypothetical protein